MVYHIVKAPDGPGDTVFAHLGLAYDALSEPVQRRLRRCVSVNSNGGAVHPLAHPHPISGRTSLYLHLGMTGAIIEKLPDGADTDAAPAAADDELAPTVEKKVAEADARFGDGSTPSELPAGRGSRFAGFRAWREADMDPFFGAFSDLLDAPEVCYSHRWEEGDVVIIDNIAVAHRAAPGAHVKDSGLRILHRTTIHSVSGGGNLRGGWCGWGVNEGGKATTRVCITRGVAGGRGAHAG